jgi:hypothetical protein
MLDKGWSISRINRKTLQQGVQCFFVQCVNSIFIQLSHVQWFPIGPEMVEQEKINMACSSTNSETPAKPCQVFLSYTYLGGTGTLKKLKVKS